MNLGVDGDSPWSDQRSNSPHKRTSVEPEDDNEAPTNTAPPVDDTPTPSSPNVVKTPGGRTSRTPRKSGVQATRLEAVDASLDPLGSLGSGIVHAEPEVDEPPELPQKEQPPRTSRPQTASSQSSRGRPEFSAAHEQNDQSTSSGVLNLQSPPPDAAARHSHPGVSVEQAARPTFYITVGDPHKVGDLTSSHTVYQVRTKTTSKAYRQPEFEVSRRYRDFLWLYNQLHSNNPGVVVPPPPEKQITGRFDSDFVEQRRSALERMLNKTASHLILQHDPDLKLFLESESFTVDIKHRERKDSDIPESKGMFSSLNLSVGSGTKFVEHDDWFLERRVYFENLETQLKGLLKATETAVGQRRALSEAAAELSTSLNTLAEVELAPSLTGPLASLSDLHIRIRDLYARQAQQDVLTLGTTIDEYIRLIGSIKKAFDQRQRSWQLWHNAESDQQKRRSALDKLSRQGRSQQDRIGQLQADVADAERRSHQARLTFDDLGKSMRAELERFEKEKVEDFRMGVETYLESAVEAQKELIELWETYLMHFDADDTEPEDDPNAPPHALRSAAAAGAAPQPPPQSSPPSKQDPRAQQHAHPSTGPDHPENYDADVDPNSLDRQNASDAAGAGGADFRGIDEMAASTAEADVASARVASDDAAAAAV